MFYRVDSSNEIGKLVFERGGKDSIRWFIKERQFSGCRIEKERETSSMSEDLNATRYFLVRRNFRK